ncbi:MAG: hypothetical protein E7582_04115 [Ruminococcaceae bacterium]|nr:hypothetical protein [Oscillospiraceae bacterium]
MSAETVTNKIEEKARESAEFIIAEAKKEAENSARKILDDAKIRENKILSQGENNAKIYESGRRQSDSLNSKIAILDLERQILEEAKSKAKAKLLNIDEETFVKIFTKHLLASSLSGEFEVVPSKVHREFVKGNIKKLEKSAGIKLTLSKNDGDFDSGFMLVGEDYDVNFTFDELIESVFERDEKVIFDILFNTGDLEK